MSLVMDILSRKGTYVAAASPSAWVADVAREMNERTIGSVLVVEESTIVGILTERDLLTRVIAATRDPASTRVGEIMTRDVIVCRPDSALDDCLRIISMCRVRHLPVVDDDGNLVGIVTSGDILRRELAERSEAIETLQAYISGPHSASP
jgi:CBS domain-containing protein